MGNSGSRVGYLYCMKWNEARDSGVWLSYCSLPTAGILHALRNGLYGALGAGGPCAAGAAAGRETQSHSQTAELGRAVI